MIIEHICIEGTIDLVPKYHTLEQTWPHSSLHELAERHCTSNPKGRGFVSHRDQANFSACPVLI